VSNEFYGKLIVLVIEKQKPTKETYNKLFGKF